MLDEIGIIRTYGGREKVEVSPLIIDGIVAIGKEIMNPMRHLNREEAINISIEAREKLQDAAKCLGLMDQIANEAAEDSKRAWREQNAR